MYEPTLDEPITILLLISVLRVLDLSKLFQLKELGLGRPLELNH